MVRDESTRRLAAPFIGRVAHAGSATELIANAADAEVAVIEVSGLVDGVFNLRLGIGQTLRGSEPGSTLRIAPGADGVCLTADNAVEALTIVADDAQCAIFNDTSVATMGHIALRDLAVRGCVRILARDGVRSGHVEMRNVDVERADARAYGLRPKGYGVEVIPGAITVWNQQEDPDVTISAELVGLSVGRLGAPARGSGVFVSGAGDVGGRLAASIVETVAVHVDGGIEPGTPDRIVGGVFIVHGAYVDAVHNLGPVTTHGPNDMVLDNWGTVDRWTADAKITSYGPSAIGFVNFGIVDRLEINAPVETFGHGARGFNVYAGTVHEAVFDRIVTRADGAVGIQISRPVGVLTVRRGIETFGGVGDSLVKGVVRKLPAIPLSVKPGGSARRVTIGGGVRANGAGIDPVEIHGAVDALEIRNGISAPSTGFAGI